MSLTITSSANNKISDMTTHHQKMVRITILAGGCNGFNKNIDLSDQIEEDDYVFECQNGKLLIDPVSFDFLKNATVDYKNDLGGSYFSITIPESKSSCGCGTSFSI